ncbi:ATP-dependent zinc metalloprotease [Acrasis kona]|uniref:ATP-dependent zinc metalloprotease n=1 Tax=Acrasis kona TaxID=1008807 RepID=A0AAW2ZQS7_9EUKA
MLRKLLRGPINPRNYVSIARRYSIFGISPQQAHTQQQSQTLNTIQPLEVQQKETLSNLRKRYNKVRLRDAFFIAFLTSFATIFFFLDKERIPGISEEPGPQIETEKSKKRLSDVKGLNPCINEIKEIIELFTRAKSTDNDGLKIKAPKGILLQGEPGTGKTLIAKAIAGECNANFISACGSDFDEMFVGVGAKRVRSLFEKARESAPCVLFIDEIDALGGKRGYGAPSHHRQSINTLLSELDGFKANEGVLVIAATNSREFLDPALVRSGRFDREIVVPKPDSKGRLEIIEYYLQNKKVAADFSPDTWSRATGGMTGAELEEIINSAALIAARNKRQEITNQDFDESYDRRTMGIEHDFYVSPQDKERTAYHELGHAFIQLKGISKLYDLHKITIKPRGSALGFCRMIPTDDSPLYSKQFLLDRIMVGLGGLIAEEVFYGKPETSSGVSSDLQQISQVARQMIMSYGMSEEFGPQLLDGELVSEETKAKVDNLMRELVKEKYNEVKQVIVDNKELIHRLASVLLQYETMTKSELVTVMNGEKMTRKVGELCIFAG